MEARAGVLPLLVLYSLALWLGLYLLARDGSDARLRWTGLGLIAYALALALPVFAPGIDWLAQTARLLLILPAICWTGALLNFLPFGTGRARMLRLWRIGVWPLVLLAVLWSGGEVTAWLVAVVLAPLVLALAMVAVQATRTRTHSAVVLLLVATVLAALATMLLVLPIQLDLIWVQVALGADLLLLGFGVAALDSFEQGDRLSLHMVRSLDGALASALLFGTPVAATMWLATGWSTSMGALLYAIVSIAIMSQVFGPQVEAVVDRVAFPGRAALQAQRADLRGAEADLPRLPEPPDLGWIQDPSFVRHTRRALSYLGNLPRLASSPLTALPIVVAHTAQQGEAHTLARAAALRELLLQAIDFLKPADGEPEFSDEWRFYNALFYPYVVGLKPYQRRADHGDLAPADRAALDWFRSQVPERTLYNWQNAAAELVAQYLRELHRSEVQGNSPADPVTPGVPNS